MKHRAPLYVFAGVLVLGDGKAIYFGTRKPDAPAGRGSGTATVTPDADPGKLDPWNGQAPPPVDAPGPDPWAPSNGGAAPVRH